MSFQAYLDAIEKKTGLTPRQILDLGKARGFDGPDTRSADVVAWLKDDYNLGRGHAMALFHVIKNGPVISDKHVGAGGSHRDETDTLWLDGIASKPKG